MVLRAKLAIITACLFWAASFIATKIALASIPPVTVVSLRLIISALCFIVWMRFKGIKIDLLKNIHLKELILLSIFGTGLHYGIQTLGLQYTTASKGGGGLCCNGTYYNNNNCGDFSGRKNYI